MRELGAAHVLRATVTMIIRRCAWHRAYHRYPMTIGIASWRGLGVYFTDGMCRGCAIRFRSRWNLPAISSEPHVHESAPALLRGVVTVALVMSLVFVIRSSDHGGLRAITTPPPETVLVPTPIEAEPAPPAPAPPTPRRVRPLKARPVPSSVAAAVAARPAPDHGFADADSETEPLVLATMTEPAPDRLEWDRSTATGRRLPGRFTFAALPHAGLTQQAP